MTNPGGIQVSVNEVKDALQTYFGARLADLVCINLSLDMQLKEKYTNERILVDRIQELETELAAVYACIRESSAKTGIADEVLPS